MKHPANNGDFTLPSPQLVSEFAGFQASTQRSTSGGLFNRDSVTPAVHSLRDFFVFFLLVQDGANSFAPFQKEVYEGVMLFRYMFGANVDDILQ